jgi:tungstate transport system ATP-binding protein
MTPPRGPAGYRLEGLRHRYGARTVLDVPSLQIAEGETLGIIGPSGAGKSTLLRILQFLEAPSEGQVWFDGQRAAIPVPATMSRRVSTVFQRPIMLDRSVRDNVCFGLRLRGPVDNALVTWQLERVGLAHLGPSPARALSGGEMQRVALARAVAVTPDVLLLDEPAANLDPSNVALVESIVRDEQRRGATIVLVTHNTHEARRLAHRTMLLLDGVPVEIGPTGTVFSAPANPRTRAFLAGDLVY